MSASSTLSLVLLLSTVACDEEPRAEEPEGPAPALDLDDPAACASCHQAVVSEWRDSMHAASHHETDPVYGAMRRLRMAREGDELATRCASCHGPRDPANPDSPAARTGVSCAACHMLDGVGDGRGAQALSFSGGVMRGPHDVTSEAGAPHGVGSAAAWLTDGRTLCLACHGEMRNPQGVPTCTTGSELRPGSDDGCVSCHMPEVEGPSGAVSSSRSHHRSHAFLGPHAAYRGDPSFLASGIELAGTFTDAELQLTVENRSGHGMPSGFPGRMVIVRAVGLSDSGDEIWENFETNPVAEDPQSVFGKAYVDDEGNPALPPYATRLARDSRLDSGETRMLSWDVPAQVARVRVTALYRLLPPPAAEALGLEDAPEGQARPFAQLEIRRPGSP